MTSNASPELSLTKSETPRRNSLIYCSRVQIDATPEAIWALLTDASSWPEWEPNCTKLEGSIELGAKLTVHTTLSKKAFPAKVTAMDAPHSMVWSWSMPLGMFRGVRTFTLTAKNGGTEVYCGEEFSGWLLFLFGKMIPDLSEAFEQFAAGLKAGAESGSR